MSRIDVEALTGRVAGFVAHLRRNDFALGPGESAAALDLLDDLDPFDPREVRLGLKSLLAGRKDEWERFDDLFEAYWQGRGRIRRRPAAPATDSRSRTPPGPWRNHLAPPPAGGAERALPPRARGPDDGEARGRGRVVASRRSSLCEDRPSPPRRPRGARGSGAPRGPARRARMRHRISRRYRNAPRAPRLDLRRTVRRNLGRGGEPVDLVRRRRRDRPVRIVVLLDVSGSMEPYSRFFLQFVKGLAGAWTESDAFLFHTRLVRVTRSDCATMIRSARCLASPSSPRGSAGERGSPGPSRRSTTATRRWPSTGRSVVIILSDGYDTGDASAMAHEMQRLRRRARRIVWLNPLLGWRGYEPVARARWPPPGPSWTASCPPTPSKPSRPSRASSSACKGERADPRGIAVQVSGREPRNGAERQRRRSSVTGTTPTDCPESMSR